MYIEVKEKFEEYVNKFDLKNKMLKLKYNHSYAVSELMNELAFRLNLDKEEIELAKIIGLLHDIGRFKQYSLYNSFNDNNIDHAVIGVDYLFKEGHIKDFIKTRKYDKIIELAIKYHNKYKVPKSIKGKSLLFVNMIRDMDKVDIYKQSAVHFDNIFDANEITKKVLNDFKKEKQILKDDRKTKTDSLILELSFIYDFNYDESFDILVETDNFDLFLGSIEVKDDSYKLFNKLKELCFNKINRGVK